MVGGMEIKIGIVGLVKENELVGKVVEEEIDKVSERSKKGMELKIRIEEKGNKEIGERNE